MKLGEFIDKFIAPNSVIRLWKKRHDRHGYEMLRSSKNDGTMMSWQVGMSGYFENMYVNYEVEFITDIVNETFPESINIVIKCN